MWRIFFAIILSTTVAVQSLSAAPAGPAGAAVGAKAVGAKAVGADGKLSKDEETQNKIEAEYDQRKKDPLLAGVLSWYTPGLGQLYGEAPLKGAAYFVIETSLFLAAFFSIADLNLSANTDSGFSIGMTFKKDEFGEIPDSNKATALTFLGLGIVFHIWNVIDAVGTTQDLNREIFRKVELKYSTKSSYLDNESLKKRRQSEDNHYLAVTTRF